MNQILSALFLFTLINVFYQVTLYYETKQVTKCKVEYRIKE
jgi:hypothetical protein